MIGAVLAAQHEDIARGGFGAPVGVSACEAGPFAVRAAVGARGAVQEHRAAQDGQAGAQGGGGGGETGQARIVGLPVQPGGFVVLAIGVVVAPLALPALIPRAQHGRALGGEDGQDQVAAAADAGGFAGRVAPALITGPFGAHGVGDLALVAVAVVLAVGVVAALGVKRGVGQGEAVMGGDEIDRGPGRAPARVEAFGRAEQA